MRTVSWAAISLVSLAGCGGRQPPYASLGLVEVSGTVTMDNQPLGNVSVAFENPQTKTFSIGRTNESGAYKLMFNSEKSGCTPGTKIVRITPYRGTESDPDEEPSDTKIPPRYNRQSELTAEVDSSHRTFDFALVSH